MRSDWPDISRLLDEALELAPDAREAWLAGLPPEDSRLRPVLDELLECGRGLHPGGFLETLPRLPGAGASAADMAAGDVVGPYRLVRPIGRGGMGSVWLAERADGLLNRRVALKLPHVVWGDGFARRLATEREILAALEHPNIARLYDTGLDDQGRPWIAMEHVEGVAIDAWCRERQASVAERLGLLMQVLGAIAHAHQRLVVHRDLKPANILVTPGGQAKLLDFGIAKLVEGDRTQATALTLVGGRALTIDYASPEQLRGEPLGTTSDVYSLGVVAYELLAQRHPFEAERRAGLALAQRMALADPSRASDAAPTRALRAALRGDLDAMLQRALEKDVSRRYPGADAFAQDIARHLAGRPVLARPASRRYRAAKFIRRHAAASVASALGACAIAAFAGTAWQQHRESTEQGLRAAAVRDFMLDLIDDAEPDERHPEADLTGRQMVAGAIARARRSFADRPRLRGELLGELAHMQARLGDDEGATRVLREANGLLEKLAPAGDPALNRTRAQLAAMAFDRGDVDEAAGLAQAAQSGCTGAGADCAKVRAYAAQTLSEVALRHDQPAVALADMREYVREAARGFGPEHSETALAWQALAVMARNSGDLAEAEGAMKRALAIAGRSTLKAADRLELSGTQALLDLDLGHFAAADTAFTALASQARAPQARALYLRLLAQGLLAQGLTGPARAAAEQAIALAPADRTLAETLFARQARARGLEAGAGGSDASARMAEVVTGLLHLGYAPESLEVLRARRFRADLLAREGALDAAAAELQEVIALQAAAPAQALELAQSLDLSGAIERLRGHPQAATALHLRAMGLWHDHLPAEHPWRLRNELYLAASRLAAEPGEDRQQAFGVLAQRYAGLFPAQSAWRTALSACTTPGLSTPGLPPHCELLL